MTVALTVANPLAITVTLVGWIVVEAVPLTENEVVRREIIKSDAKGSHERPAVFATVKVRYTVREQAAEGEPPDSGRKWKWSLAAQGGVASDTRAPTVGELRRQYPAGASWAWW